MGERWGLRWPGDEAARARAAQPTPGQLEGAGGGPHRFIEGDNLPVLQALGPSLAGQVRIAYLDPPYNTGTAMRYADRFAAPSRAWTEAHGEDAWGQRHAAWLSFMWPRLVLVRALLAPDGVLFASIDDRETHHLRMLLDAAFGEANFVGTVVWRKRVVRGRGARHLLPQTEHIHVYARDATRLPAFEEPLTDAMRAAYDARDEAGPYKLLPLAKSGTAHSPRPNLVYPIQAPDGSWIACPTHQWRWSQETLEARRDELVFRRGRDGAWRIYTKQRLLLPDGERGRTPTTYYDRATTADGTAEVKALFGRPVLDFPKPVRLIKDLIGWATPRGGRRDEVVLDPFAGTCPTAQAVLELNAEDGGARRFVCIQAPEALKDPEFETIAALARARIAHTCARLGVPVEAVAQQRWVPGLFDRRDEVAGCERGV
ncbi:MAG: site-specific DNA-methyltransferase [Candidatus Sericytochromatia bacterium]|nr:site-specific DNA-methyltransferase [Candidatus Sericytochromatia bacterium]